jgi:hypothetical protein
MLGHHPWKREEVRDRFWKRERTTVNSKLTELPVRLALIFLP